MDKFMDKLQEFKAKHGIDLLGFAPRERFAGVPEHNNPFAIFPEAKTVIMLGKRICRGSLRGVEEGSNFSDYRLFGLEWLEDEFLSLACYELTRLLEDEGWEGVPIFPNPPEVPPMGVPVAADRPAPNVFPDFDYCAVAAGLAELSYSGLVFTKEFGSRQRFHMVITDAELPATPLLEQTVCDGCLKCADACPHGAISKDAFTTVDICGKQMRVAVIDYGICRKCQNGALKNRHYSDGAQDQDIWKQLHNMGTDKQKFSGAKPDRIAALCNRTCLCHLENDRRIDNLFENGFRQNDSWALNLDGSWKETEHAK